MVDRIGGGSSLAREAILAALKSQARVTESVQGAAAEIASSAPGRTEKAGASDFGAALQDGLREVDTELRRAQDLPQAVATGKIDDFHEVAAQLKRADLSFKFALEIRNKLIDAYREVMRMSV